MFAKQVVILQPPVMAPLPAFAGDNVKVPMTYGEANYFCRRKITMVSKRAGRRSD